MKDLTLRFIKKHPVKLLFIVLLLLNTFGFCYKRMWFLSDQERIEIAVRNSVVISTSAETVETTILTKSGWQKISEVPYRSVNEFLLLNPNCCTVSRQVPISEGINSVTLIGCMTGLAPYFVSGSYKQKYTENERIKTQISSFTYRMSSCGSLRHPNPRRFFDIWNWS